MSISANNSILKKTLKREFAAIAAIFWGLLTYKMFWGILPTDIEHYVSIYNNITWIVWFYISGAFGSDALFKYLQQVKAQ